MCCLGQQIYAAGIGLYNPTLHGLSFESKLKHYYRYEKSGGSSIVEYAGAYDKLTCTRQTLSRD